MSEGEPREGRLRLSRRTIQIFWDVHAIAGVSIGILLHVIFYTGALVMFSEDLTAWQERPAAAGAPRPLSALVEPVVRARQLEGQTIDLTLPTERRPALLLRYEPRGAAAEEIVIDPRSGEAAPARSHLSRMLVQLHFLYHERFPFGVYVAGLVGAAMLLTIVTGTLIHLRDLLRELHQFRPLKRVMTLWSDAHKVLGVFGLPFQLTLAFTGAMLCLGPMLLMAAFTGPVFKGNPDAAGKALLGGATAPAARGEKAPSIALDDVLARARVAVPGFTATEVRVAHVGDVESSADLFGEVPGLLFGRGRVLVRMRDGEVLAATSPATETTGVGSARYVYGFHFGWFGGAVLKVIYALLALGGCGTILTGNWIWIRRRAPGDRLGPVLERLTVGAAAGLSVGTAALFLANRLAGSMGAETVALFGGWGLATVWCFVRPSLKSWVELLVLSGALFALAALATAITRGGRALGAVDLGLVVMAAAVLGLARAIHARASMPSRGVAPERLPAAGAPSA